MPRLGPSAQSELHAGDRCADGTDGPSEARHTRASLRNRARRGHRIDEQQRWRILSNSPPKHPSKTEQQRVALEDRQRIARCRPVFRCHTPRRPLPQEFLQARSCGTASLGGPPDRRSRYRRRPDGRCDGEPRDNRARCTSLPRRPPQRGAGDSRRRRPPTRGVNHDDLVAPRAEVGAQSPPNR